MDEGLVLLNACCDNDLGVLHEALLRGADPNVWDHRGRSCLHLAAIRGSEAILRALLEAGGDVNAGDCHGNTPLHCCGHQETVNVLLEYGAPVHARNLHGDTPLVLLERRGGEEAVLTLLEAAMEQHVDAQEELVLPTRHPDPVMTVRQKQHGLAYVRGVWYEFCADLGVERLVIVIVIALCFSLYVAYIVTGVAKRIDMRIPIDINSAHQKQEL